MGAEFRAALWLARHPGALAVPAAVGAGVVELGPALAGGIAGGLTAGALGWYRAHPDTFDTHAAPVLRAWQRRWVGPYVGLRWRDLMACCELTRVHPRTGETMYPRVLRVRALSPHIDLVTVKLARGQSARTFTDRLGALASTMKAERVALELDRPGQVVLVVQRSEPFQQVIPAPEMPESADAVDLRAVYLGETELGGEWAEPVLGAHSLTAGATGSGKNSVAYAKFRAMAPLIRDGLVRPWVCDPKMLEFKALEPILDGRYANDPADCRELIETFVDNMKRKQKRMQRERVRSAPVCPEYPLDWLVVDEIGSLLAYQPEEAREITSLLSVVTSMGRVTHDSLDCYIQEPSKDVLPIRDLLTHRVCLRVTSERHPDMVLGDDARARGAIADEIPADESTAGIGFRIDQRSRYPRRVRAAYTSDADIAEFVAFVRNGRAGLRVVA
jgi:S-DNA-T family DNA segregation ATPase FtsK/SpoIIIE